VAGPGRNRRHSLDSLTLVDGLALFGFLSISAVLAAAEFAFFPVSRAELALSSDSLGARAVRMLGKPRDLLIGLVVGISISNVAAVVFVLRIASRAFTTEPRRTVALLVALLVVSVLIAIVGRLLPRVYVAHNPETAALALAWPVAILLVPFYPLMKLVLFLTSGLSLAQGVKRVPYRVLGDDAVGVDGSCRIEEVNAVLGTNISRQEGCDTIAGFVRALVGRTPAEGNEYTAQGLVFLVEKVAGETIEQVVIKGRGLGRARGLGQSGG
jgi:CBS domain containing-hemolysin-like protein